MSLPAAFGPFSRTLEVLGVKDKIQTIDLPHELGAKFNSLFELLLRFAL